MDQKLLDSLVARAEQRARSMSEAKQFFMPGVGMVEFVKPKQAAQIEYYGALAESLSPEDALRLSVSRKRQVSCAPVFRWCIWTGMRMPVR